MRTIWTVRGKDEDPVTTVNKIQQILNDIGIETEYKEAETGMDSCKSARVTVKGPLSDFIGTNGKGINSDFCRASAYAEFMERLQNRAIAYMLHPMDDAHAAKRYQKLPRHLSIHSLAENIPQNSTYVKNVMDAIAGQSDFPVPFFNERSVKKELSGTFCYFPVYNTQTKQYEDFPVQFSKMFTHSNGMAAGNTVEEAIVQAYSEIFERMAQTAIMTGPLTPPRIPESVIARYPDTQKIIDEINALGKYTVTLHDCSLGRRLPVVCSIMTDRENQTFGVRFGAHPNMGVAMERTLTEAFQGRNPKQFTGSNKGSFVHNLVNDPTNLMNTKKTGAGFYPYEILADTPSYSFTDWDLRDNVSNTELVRRMTKQFHALGHNIYIQDVSFLGFPTVYVIAEGASELHPKNFLYLKELRLARRVSKFMMASEPLTEENVREILNYCFLKRSAIIENKISSIYKLPLDQSFYAANELDFLAFLCYYYLNEQEKAMDALQKCRPPFKDDHGYLNTVKKYVSAVYNGYDDASIATLLSVICGSDMTARVISDFTDRKLVFRKLYPSCCHFNCNSCNNSCCKYKEARDLDDKIWAKFIQWNGSKNTIHKIFL